MNFDEYEDRIRRLAPGGCYIALRLGFYAPEAELNLFPSAWVNHYTVSGHALVDPLLVWCQANEGCIRWSNIEISPSSAVLQDYRAYGFQFGSVVSSLKGPMKRRRSLGIFARFDREMSDLEMRELTTIVNELHAYEPLKPTHAQIEALQLYSQGLLQKQIAHELDISVSAVKARLRGGADRLGVKTPREAAFIAFSRNLM